MARIGMKHTSEVQTRDKYTKAAFDLTLSIEGKELPTAAVLGAALEEAQKLIQDRIVESYQVVPPRNDVVPAGAVVTQASLRLSWWPPAPGGLGFPPGVSS